MSDKGRKLINPYPVKNCSDDEDIQGSGREIAPNDGDSDEEDDEIQMIMKQNEDSKKKKETTEERLEEVSEQGSELFETDSSCGEDGQDEELLNAQGMSPDHDFGQGKDIVAGSPTKHTRNSVEMVQEELDFEKTPGEEGQEEEPTGREEMNGIIVYDSYAKLTGCEKIVQYFEEQQHFKINPYILFSKDEVKQTAKEIFTDRARERDFASEQDRHVFRNLPRFSYQRDFSNPQFEIFVPQQQNVLIFDSRFENGNLRKVAKVNNIEYNLWLENDLNTKGHTQWYYFKVVYKDIALRADKKTHKIKFSILNLAKTTSLYQVGMKPCIWSKRKFESKGVGWFRGGEEVTYTKNDIVRETDSNSYQKMHQNLNNNNAFLYNNNGAGEGVDTYFTLSFTYEFEPNVDDEVYFAHAIPSTYTQMQEKLQVIRKEPKYQSYMKMNILCQTLAKVPVPLITITENVNTYLDYYEEVKLMNHIPGIVRKAFKQKYSSAQKLAKQSEESKGRVARLLQAAIEEELKQFFEFNEDHLIQTNPSFQGFDKRLTEYVRDHSQKQAVVFTSRVHPGEAQASHMLEGILEFLLSPAAENLRKNFVFRIVPMLNPDGVIYGNYRCSLLGCDLNRKWEKPNRLLHPPVFYTKNLIRQLHQERKVLLYCDLHGHSRKKNAFFYGCSFKNYEQEGRVRNAQLRLIPLMCCQKSNLFRLKDCRFRIEKNKESTARVVVFKEFNIMNSFTLECSFFAKEGDKTEMKPDALGRLKKIPPQQMTVEEYQSLGKTLAQTLFNFLPQEQHKLQFLAGKILDVFYDEFIKFVPPYILKREQEKQKKHQESGLSQNPKQKQLGRLGSQELGSKQLVKKTMSYGTTGGFLPVGMQGLRAIAGGDPNSQIQRHASTNAYQNPKPTMGYPSGTDTEANERLPNGDDILEFENFMDNLQTMQKYKDQIKQDRKNRRNEAKDKGLDYESDNFSLSSGDSSGDEYYKKKKKKKKNKTQPRNVERTNVQKKNTQDLNISAISNTQQTPNGKTAKLLPQQPSNTKQQNNTSSKKQRSPESNIMKVYNIKTQEDAQPEKEVMSSAQIQNMIQTQLSSGVLKQSEILQEIQRAIQHNKKILNQNYDERVDSSSKNERHSSSMNQGQRSIANAIFQNALKQHNNTTDNNSSSLPSIKGNTSSQMQRYRNLKPGSGLEPSFDSSFQQRIVEEQKTPVFFEDIQNNKKMMMTGIRFKENDTSSMINETQFLQEIQFSPSQNGPRTQKLKKEFKMSRNMNTINNNEAHVISGTFDASRLNQQQVKGNNVNIFSEPTRPSKHLGIDSINSSQNGISNPDFSKNDFKKSQMLQSIANPKSIQPILGLKSNIRQIYQTSSSQQQDLNFSHQKINYLSPQGINVNQKTFNNQKYILAKQRQQNIQQMTQSKKEQNKDLFILGNMDKRGSTCDKSDNMEKISQLIYKHKSPNKTKDNKNKNVMKELQDQIAQETASLDLIQKQQQLQMQLEKQQALLQQLQHQLNMQNTNRNFHLVASSNNGTACKSNRGSNIGIIPREFINFNNDAQFRQSNEWQVPIIAKGQNTQAQSPIELNYNYFNRSSNKAPANAAQYRLQKIGKQMKGQNLRTPDEYAHQTRRLASIPQTQAQSPQKQISVANYVQNINVFVSESSNQHGYNLSFSQEPQQMEFERQNARAHSNLQMNKSKNNNPMTNNAILKSIEKVDTRQSINSPKKWQQVQGSSNNKNR